MRKTAKLTGPFLSPGALGRGERLRLVDGIETLLEGVYTHLPLKRARYGFDPVQRLRILRTQVDELTDDGFHIELADIITRMRDAHTCYTGPTELRDKVAALPFLVEMIGSAEAPMYIVTKVGAGLDSAFKPGVVLEYWNGVPIDRAVQRYSDREFGGRPDSQRACAVQSLTLRPLRYRPPPDEYWVVIGYRPMSANGKVGPAKEIKLPWQIIDPSEIDTLQAEGLAAKRAQVLGLKRAVDPAAEAVRRAKMLLFAPQALFGEQTRVPTKARAKAKRDGATRISAIPTHLTQTLKVTRIETANAAYGHLRIFGFNSYHEEFIEELRRLIPLLPDTGLIIDIRGNPGGYILAAEHALQLFTPNRIEPTRFSALATPFTRKMAQVGVLKEDLAPWKESLDAAVRNGELYAQPIPISDPAECNQLGQHYGGPVVLVGDATTYSAGDLFAAGFVDNAIGPFLCVGTATGAGGANVWDYAELRDALAGSRASLPMLPDGIGLTFSFRRATRAAVSEGLPIEDVGVEGICYAMTRDDLLCDNRDLIGKCIALLKKQPFSRLNVAIDTRRRALIVGTQGLDQLDVLIDGHPGTSQKIGRNSGGEIEYPAGTEVVELIGYAGGSLRQRRKLVPIGSLD